MFLIPDPPTRPPEGQGADPVLDDLLDVTLRGRRSEWIGKGADLGDLWNDAIDHVVEAFEKRHNALGKIERKSNAISYEVAAAIARSHRREAPPAAPYLAALAHVEHDLGELGKMIGELAPMVETIEARLERIEGELAAPAWANEAKSRLGQLEGRVESYLLGLNGCVERLDAFDADLKTLMVEKADRDRRLVVEAAYRNEGGVLKPPPPPPPKPHDVTDGKQP